VRKVLYFVLLIIFLLPACSTTSTPAPISAPDTQVVVASPTGKVEQRTLIVFAAASLTDAFEQMGKSFEVLRPGVKVRINFAGSQALRTQIEQGAVVDVFASANRKEMDTLMTEGFVVSDAPQIFLTNQLMIILPAANPAGIEKIEDLASPGIKLVLADEDVPVGKYARQVLEKMSGQFGIDFKDKVLSNVVSNEDNVKQVVIKVQLGEADAGIVYKSDTMAAPDVWSVEIPADMNVIAEYPIAVLAQSPQADLASDFVAYVLSSEGQTILQNWRFSPIQ
jgi:molybdate transport system substrate-binding protein